MFLVPYPLVLFSVLHMYCVGAMVGVVVGVLVAFVLVAAVSVVGFLVVGIDVGCYGC